MAGTLPAGPFGTLPLAGRNVPFYVVPFDKDGFLQAPATATRLVADIAQDANDVVSDVIVVVHGWNTDFNGALRLSRNFVGRWWSASFGRASFCRPRPRPPWRPPRRTMWNWMG